MSSQSHERRERTQILIANSMYRRHRQTSGRQQAGEVNLDSVAKKGLLSQSPRAPRRAELRDGYSKEKEEQVQSLDMGRIGQTGW